MTLVGACRSCDCHRSATLEQGVGQLVSSCCPAVERERLPAMSWSCINPCVHRLSWMCVTRDFCRLLYPHCPFHHASFCTLSYSVPLSASREVLRIKTIKFRGSRPSSATTVKRTRAASWARRLQLLNLWWTLNSRCQPGGNPATVEGRHHASSELPLASPSWR